MLERLPTDRTHQKENRRKKNGLHRHRQILAEADVVILLRSDGFYRELSLRCQVATNTADLCSRSLGYNLE